MMNRHIMREQGRWWCLAATVLATGICLAVLAKQPPTERSGQYRTPFDRLLTVEDAKRDTAFAQRSLITGGLREELAYPARLRSLVTSWDGSRLFGIPAIEYRHGDGRITLCWETKFRPPGTTEEVRSQFLDRVRSLGFEQVDTDLVTHLRGPYQRIALDSLSFPNRSQDEDDIRRWEQLASRTAGASWQHEPWYVYAQRWERDYRTSWRLLQDEDRTLHEIELRASPYTRDAQKVSWVRLSSLWRPADSGWGADFVCDSIGTPRDASDDPTLKRWYVYFREYRADSPQTVATLSYFPGLSRYYDIKRLGGTTYDLYVILESTKSNCVSHATLKSWLASPQTLRDTGLAWVDQLSAKVERQIRSGKAIRRAYIFEERGADHRSASPGRVHPVSLTSHFASPTPTLVRLVSTVPPIPEPPVVRDSDRKLTRDEQDAIIREAQAKFDWQRQQLREHCEELHAALLKAFPLLDCL